VLGVQTPFGESAGIKIKVEFYPISSAGGAPFWTLRGVWWIPRVPSGSQGGIPTLIFNPADVPKGLRATIPADVPKGLRYNNDILPAVSPKEAH
jgi:hypothetical protein